MTKKTNKYKPTIKDWPEDERPRERLIKQGSDKLSDTELLAIILRTGEWHEGDNAIDLARKLIVRFGSLRHLDSASISELSQLKGIGILKAAEIKAALEIGKRIVKQKVESKKKIESSEDVINYYAPYLRDLKEEVFKVMLLDGRNKLIKDLTISEGGLNSATVDPKVVLKEAAKESAPALILVHNHPSGESDPTEEDIKITTRLIQSCELVGLRVLDHIIVGANNYTSFLEKGLIKED